MVHHDQIVLWRATSSFFHHEGFQSSVGAGGVHQVANSAQILICGVLVPTVLFKNEFSYKQRQRAYSSIPAFKQIKIFERQQKRRAKLGINTPIQAIELESSSKCFSASAIADPGAYNKRKYSLRGRIVWLWTNKCCDKSNTW